MDLDDVQICNIIDHDDYPSYPQVAESKDYNIGTNVCWLWRDNIPARAGFSKLFPGI